MSRHFFSLRLATAALALAMAPTLAFAYIDPGNGAYMVQALFALFAAGMFYVRHPVRTLKLLVGAVAKRLHRRAETPTMTDLDPAVTGDPAETTVKGR